MNPYLIFQLIHSQLMWSDIQFLKVFLVFCFVVLELHDVVLLFGFYVVYFFVCFPVLLFVLVVLFLCFSFCFGWFDWFFFVSIFSLPLVFVSCFCLVFTSSFSFISSVKIDIWFDILKFSACNLLITSLDVIFCSLAYS